MPWWRKLLALLGLSEDARVRVRAPGIEVIITGDPDTVRSVLSAVKAEIGRSSSRRRGESVISPPAASPAAPAPAPAAAAAQARDGKRRKKGSVSQVVRPTDLDEMDSPYAIPEHVPAQAHDETETPADGLPAERTMNVDGMIVSSEDDPEPEPTAVDVRNPSSVALPATLVPQIADNIDRTARSSSGLSEEATVDAPRAHRAQVVVGKKLDPTETD
ncbi:MAG: hypothetical protein U1E65_19600 [Myxococcota bacterium]